EFRLEDRADAVRERVQCQPVGIADHRELDPGRAVEPLLHVEELKIRFRADGLLPEAPQEALLFVVVEARELLKVLRREHDASSALFSTGHTLPAPSVHILRRRYPPRYLR